MWELVKQFLVYNFGFLAGIFERIDQILAFWTFLAIGFVCGGFLIATMVLGELSELFEDVFSGDHDISADHDIDHDVGHDNDGDAGHDGLADMHAPSMFSFRIILAFFAGFGIAGAIAIHFDQSILMSSLYGIGTGFVMGILNYFFVLFLAAG